MAYANSGSIGAADADILITLKPGWRIRPKATSKPLREKLPRLFPGTTFAFLPADMVSQILNFGLPAPIDVQVIGQDLEADRAYANKIFAKVANVTGVADPRIQQAFNVPTLYVDVNRSLAGTVGLYRKGRRIFCAGHACRQFSNRADLLAQSEERRLLSDRRPDAAILGRFARRSQ